MRKLLLLAGIFPVVALAQPIPPGGGGTATSSIAASYTSTAASGSPAFKLKVGAKVYFDYSGTVNIYESGGALLSSVRVGAPDFSSTAASGSSAFLMASGARLCLNSDSACSDWIKDSGGMIYTSGGLTVSSAIYTGNGLIGTQAGSTGFVLGGNINNAAGSVAVKIYNATTLTTGGDRYLMAWYSDNNATTKVATMQTNGAIQLNMGGAGEPTCSSALRGTLHYVQNAGGDHVDACMLGTDGSTYSWVVVKAAP